MKDVSILKWLIAIDEEKTKQLYSERASYCDCLDCRNFSEASKHVTDAVQSIFSTLAVDAIKPSHLSEFGADETGKHNYIGSYHIIGKLISGPLARDSEWDKENTASLDDYTFAINPEITFTEIKENIIQLDFSTKLPWVLSEKSV